MGAQAPREVGVTVVRVVGEAPQRRGFWKALMGRPQRPLFDRPFGLAWNGDDLLVTDPGAGRVFRVGKDDRVARTEAGTFSSPIGIASCVQGILVTDSIAGNVTLLSESLKPIRQIAGGLERPTGIACADGRIFVVETARHRILELDPQGGILRAYGKRGLDLGEFNFPTAIALGGEAAWVADTLNFRLQRLKMEPMEAQVYFGHLGDAGGETPRVKGIALDETGRIWVTDAYLDAVSIFREDGTYLATVGHRGELPGEFSLPAGIAINSHGDVAVADSLNRRIQILRLEPDRTLGEAP